MATLLVPENGAPSTVTVTVAVVTPTEKPERSQTMVLSEKLLIEQRPLERWTETASTLGPNVSPVIVKVGD